MNAEDTTTFLDTHNLTLVHDRFVATERKGKRECGTCDACCTVMAVPELAKVNYVRCEHKGECGCKIYDDRPHSCRVWGCNWLLGLLGDHPCRRPDQLGLLFTLDWRGGKCLLTAYEVWDGAAKGEKAAYLLRKLGRTYPIILVHPSMYFEALSPDEHQRKQLAAHMVGQTWTGA